MAIQSMTLDPNAQSYANLAALDSAAAIKLSGIEAGATADMTGPEIRDAIVAIPDATRKIIITDPIAGQFKVVSEQRDAAGKLSVKYDDVAV